MDRHTLSASLVCVVWGAMGGAVHGAAIQGLGFLPGTSQSFATAISSDGTVVVGYTSSDFYSSRSFRWERGKGMTELSPLASDVSTQATVLSADGRFSAGLSIGGISWEQWHTARWTSDGTPEYLTGGKGIITFPEAFGISGDGSRILLQSGPSRFVYLWTNGTVQQLNVPTSMQSGVGDLSRDGRTVVGSVAHTKYPASAYRYRHGAGYTMLPGLVDQWAIARLVSADGDLVVGTSAVNQQSHLVRWDAAGEIEDLGVPSFARLMFLDCMTPDAQVIIGRSITGTRVESWRWIQDRGFELFTDVLVEANVDLAGWTLLEVSGLSDNGLTFMGSGRNPSGQWEAWIVTIPAPGTAAFSLAVTAVSVVSSRRRR